MARKGWNQISDSYRDRLERGGVTKAAYDRGESLSSARGHGATPEKPLKDFENVPAKYQGYADLRKEILNLKKELYGDKSTFKSRPESLQGMSRSKLEAAKFALEKMKELRISLDELREMFPEYDGDEWDWLEYYH